MGLGEDRVGIQRDRVGSRHLRGMWWDRGRKYGSEATGGGAPTKMLGLGDTLVTDWRYGRGLWVLRLEIVASDRRSPQCIDWGGRISMIVMKLLSLIVSSALSVLLQLNLCNSSQASRTQFSAAHGEGRSSLRIKWLERNVEAGSRSGWEWVTDGGA